MSKNFKDAISKEAYESALRKSWDEKLEGETFDDTISYWIAKTATKLGVPEAYLTFPLLSATAFTLGESYVKVCDSYKEPIIIYSLVAGRSGTNKSGSLSTITNLIQNLPSQADRSHLFDTGIHSSYKSDFL